MKIPVSKNTQINTLRMSDAYQNHSSQCSSELCDYPLVRIRSPDADTITLLHTEVKESRGEILRLRG